MAKPLSFSALVSATGRDDVDISTGMGLVNRASDIEYESIVREMPVPEDPSPSTTKEMFMEGSRAGFQQLLSDVDRVKAIGYTLGDNEEKAQDALTAASVHDTYGSNILSGFGTFEEFLEEPTYESFWEQVVKNVGQFTPMAVSSIATGFTGAIAGAAVKGTISVGSRALMKKELSRIIQKKHLSLAVNWYFTAMENYQR